MCKFPSETVEKRQETQQKSETKVEEKEVRGLVSDFMVATIDTDRLPGATQELRLFAGASVRGKIIRKCEVPKGTSVLDLICVRAEELLVVDLMKIMHSGTQLYAKQMIRGEVVYFLFERR